MLSISPCLQNLFDMSNKFMSLFNENFSDEMYKKNSIPMFNALPQQSVNSSSFNIIYSVKKLHIDFL